MIKRFVLKEERAFLPTEEATILRTAVLTPTAVFSTTDALTVVSSNTMCIDKVPDIHG